MRVSVYAVAVAALAGCTVTQNPGQDVDSGGLEGEAGGSIDAAGSDGAAGPDGLAGEDASAGMNDSPSGTGADGTAASDLDGSDAALAEGAPGEAGGGADAGMASDAEQADATTTETTIGPFCGCPSGTTFDGRSCNPSDGCGAQTTPCSLPNATATCQAGACAVFQCAADYGDCNAQAADGCETSLRTSNADCGACGQACTGGATCIDGVCSVGCAPPLTSCSGTCADLVTSTAHCGGCSTGCASAYDQTATCVNGMCVYSAMTCPPGQTSCNGDCVDTTRDPSNCGGCYTSCYANGLVGVCTNGQCSPCPSGLVTCPNPAGLPFPCVDTRRSIANCGACGAGCSANQTCSMGTCVPLTSAAFVTGIAVDDMAVDDTSIYFVSSGAGTVSVLPKTGGTAPRTLATGEAKPVHIALDAQYVYYSANLGGAIKRVPKNGATPAAVVVPTTQPTELVVDSQRVYWVSGTTLSAAPSSGGGHSRANGSDTVRVKSRNPPETSPSTPRTLARKLAGSSPPASATASPQSERIRHQSRIEPS